MNINEMITQAMEEQLESKETKEFIEKKAKEMIQKAIVQSFNGYKGVGDVLEEKIKETMIPMVEMFDITQHDIKLDLLLTEVINKQTKENSEILRNFKSLTQVVGKDVTIEDIVKKWVEYAEDEIDTTELEPCVDNPSSYEAVEYRLGYRKGSSNGDLIISLTCEKDPSLDKEIELYKFKYSSIPDNYKIWGVNEEFDLNSLKNLDEFNLYIHALKMNDVRLDFTIDDLEELAGETMYSPIYPNAEVEYMAM